jgi:hypothetical protein
MAYLDHITLRTLIVHMVNHHHLDRLGKVKSDFTTDGIVRGIVRSHLIDDQQISQTETDLTGLTWFSPTSNPISWSRTLAVGRLKGKQN